MSALCQSRHWEVGGASGAIARCYRGSATAKTVMGLELDCEDSTARLGIRDVTEDNVSSRNAIRAPPLKRRFRCYFLSPLFLLDL
jgi:hypothetical protein